jgi:hypothetical protein
MAPVAPRVFQCQTSHGVGTHSITATYNGDPHFLPSTSPVLYQVVQGAIVVLSPTHFNFGNETVGITGTPKVAMLTNSGNIALAITSIQVTLRGSRSRCRMYFGLFSVTTRPWLRLCQL